MIRLGEPVFRSIQGEGLRTGVLSIWVRFFGCNLNCSGFMQPDPANSSTYILPQLDKNTFKGISVVTDLPVFERGCDSGYSWAPHFKHLTTNYKTADELHREAIEPLLYNKHWFSGKHNGVDLCFTGGEPMLQQKKIVEIYKAATQTKPDGLDSFPECVQIETNGTQKLTRELIELVQEGYDFHSMLGFNISPKLFYVSGEQDKDAWKPDVIESYWNLDGPGHLKFVMNNDPRAWDELNRKVDELRERHIYYPIYIMPVGATKEQQENTDQVKRIAEKAIEEGYHVSGRLHAIIFGNGVGT